jgi:hypothetical protein
MAAQTQNSTRYSIVSAVIAISKKNIEIGKIIGRKGRNLKPIAERTCTHIHVIDNTNPTQVEIKNKAENNSPGKGIDEAICQIDKLLEDIEIRDQKKDIVKGEKRVRFSDNNNYQHAMPRNHNDNDLKEEGKRVRRKKPRTNKKRQVRYFKNI